MRFQLMLIAAAAALAFSAVQAAAADGDRPRVAQNVSVDDFQFNELDFDRQPAGTRPAAPAQPAARMLPGQEGDLTNLFSDQDAPPPAPPASTGLGNLPGVPSPTATPAGQGEAKIELATPGAPAAQPGGQAAPTAARQGGSRSLRPAEARVGNRWYWAHEAWRHGEIPLSDCQSYTESRPLYHVRCVSTVASVNRRPVGR